MRSPLVCLFLLAATLPTVLAETPAPPPATVQVLMLSDLHFDPFRNITDAQLKQLIADPPEQWANTFAQPAKGAPKLTNTCDGIKKFDTDYTLLTSSLAAEQAKLPAPLFITVSGDLTTHNFNCKYYALVKKNPSATGLSDFSAKTVAFVALQLNAAFPKSPVYLALGNNDSGCEDYLETEASSKVANPYFDNVAKVFATVALDSNNAKSILATLPTRGDYSVLLPKPFADTRLIVLQDLFESASYKGPCSGAYPVDAVPAQIAWLKTQLADAKVKHFWIMAHIAPGVDPYYTIHSNHGCPANPTLSTSDLADTLRKSTSDIELVLYGHTHMDEMRLIRDSSGDGKVAGRLNPSITPWTGNYPSFTVGDVDPARALLVNFTVYRSSDKTGSSTGNWNDKYSYSGAYGEPDYSAASLNSLANIFKNSTSKQVAAYQKYYQSSPATSNWNAYRCAIVSDTLDEYNACYTCPTTTPSH